MRQLLGKLIIISVFCFSEGKVKEWGGNDKTDTSVSFIISPNQIPFADGSLLKGYMIIYMCIYVYPLAVATVAASGIFAEPNSLSFFLVPYNLLPQTSFLAFLLLLAFVCLCVFLFLFFFSLSFCFFFCFLGFFGFCLVWLLLWI